MLHIFESSSIKRSVGVWVVLEKSNRKRNYVTRQINNNVSFFLCSFSFVQSFSELSVSLTGRLLLADIYFERASPRRKIT